MPNKRSEGKRLIGAQASPELWEGVDEWLAQNPNSTVTDFVLEALIEKLGREKIPIDPAVALRDFRSRSHRVNSAKKSPEEKFVDDIEAAADAHLAAEDALKIAKRRPRRGSSGGSNKTPAE